MGMVTVAVCYEVVGQFLDLCEETIARVVQDDTRRVCRFVLHVPEMASCEAEVVIVSRAGGVTAWLVPVVPTLPDPVLGAALDELLRRREAS